MIGRAALALVPVFGIALAVPANAAVQTPLPQLLPQPVSVPPPPVAPLPPPTNPGYAATPPNGLSPLLTQPGPLYQSPSPAAPAYPRLQLPGPVDQQKMQAYRNNLLGQQWRAQRQGTAYGNAVSRELQRQLAAPDPQ